MRCFVFAVALLGAAGTAALAQDAIPDLKGTWTGKGKAVVFGNNPHHSGTQMPTDPPRVREIEATHTVEGQDGRVAWGRSSSGAADTKEPFAWAIASDNRTRLELSISHTSKNSTRASPWTQRGKEVKT
jgi:hypothetical protein